MKFLLQLWVLLYVLAFPAEGTLAHMIAESGLGASAFRSQLPKILSFVGSQFKNPHCKREFMSLKKFVDDGSIESFFSSQGQGQRFICENFSKPCAVEAGEIGAKIVGQDAIKSKLSETFGADSDLSGPGFKLSNLIGMYFDSVCNKNKKEL